MNFKSTNILFISQNYVCFKSLKPGLRVAFPTKERPLWYTTKSRSCLLVVNVNLRKSLTEMLVVRIGRRL